MDPLPHPPKTFRDIIESDLRRAARLLIKVQDEIDPQLRIATPDGDYALAITLPTDAAGRSAMLRRVATLMTWKRAVAFTFACEIAEPDAVYCTGIAATQRHHCIARINRSPQPWTASNFAPIEWLPPEAIDPGIAELLATGPRPLRPQDVAEANAWFGPNGTFPAVHVPTQQLRKL